MVLMKRLLHVWANYSQIVKKPTPISDSVLDHVYLHHDFLSEFSVENVIDVYFSDPDAGHFRFKKY